jgi:hypothetical protein
VRSSLEASEEAVRGWVMPCGGIWPAMSGHPCWVCGEIGCDLFCEEWDTPLHKRCLGAFLKTEEGQCVIEHGHNIIQGGEPPPPPLPLPLGTQAADAIESLIDFVETTYTSDGGSLSDDVTERLIEDRELCQRLRAT